MQTYDNWLLDTHRQYLMYHSDYSEGWIDPSAYNYGLGYDNEEYLGPLVRAEVDKKFGLSLMHDYLTTRRSRELVEPIRVAFVDKFPGFIEKLGLKIDTQSALKAVNDVPILDIGNFGNFDKFVKIPNNYDNVYQLQYSASGIALDKPRVVGLSMSNIWGNSQQNEVAATIVHELLHVASMRPTAVSKNEMGQTVYSTQFGIHLERRDPGFKSNNNLPKHEGITEWATLKFLPEIVGGLIGQEVTTSYQREVNWFNKLPPPLQKANLAANFDLKVDPFANHGTLDGAVGEFDAKMLEKITKFGKEL